MHFQCLEWGRCFVRIEKSKFSRNLLGLSIGLSPVYLWMSGLPQISDMLFFILGIFCLIANRISVEKLNASAPVIIVLMYYVIVNLLSAIFLEATHKFLVIFYILFTLLVVPVASAMSEENILKGLETGFVLGFFILLTQLALGIDKYPGYRYSLGFNNPNQLGYFALCGFSFFLLRSIFSEMTLRRVLILTGFFMFVILSFSKGAIVSLLVAFLLFLFASKKMGGLSLSIFLIALSTLAIYLAPDLGDQVFNRIVNIGGQSDDSLEARGYLMFFQYPEAFVFGQGGASYLDRGDSHEIHSTYANIFVSYGAVGLIGFLYVVGKASIARKGFIVIVPMLLYGLTHNIIRDEFFWLITTLLFVSVYLSRREKSIRRLTLKNSENDT